MKDIIEKMGMLARLKVADKDVQAYADKFKRVLEYVETLKKVNVEGLEATSHASDMAEAFREDIVCSWPNPKDFLKISPKKKQPQSGVEGEAPMTLPLEEATRAPLIEQFFIVPKVIE